MQRTYTLDDIIQLYRDYPRYFSTARKYDKTNEREANFQNEFFCALEHICLEELIGEDTGQPALIYQYTEDEIRAAYRKKVEEYQVATLASSTENDFSPLRDFFACYPALRKVISKNMGVLTVLAQTYEGTLGTNKILFSTYYQMKEPELKAMLLKSGVQQSQLAEALNQVKHSLEKVNMDVATRVYVTHLDSVVTNWLFQTGIADLLKQEAIAYLTSLGIKLTNLEEALKLIHCEEILKKIDDIPSSTINYRKQVKFVIGKEIRLQALENLHNLNNLKDYVSVTTQGKFQQNKDPVQRLIAKYLKQLVKQEAIAEFLHDHPKLGNLLIYFAKWHAGAHEFRQEFDKYLKQIFEACIQNDIPRIKDSIKNYFKTSEAREFFYDATTREIMLELVVSLDVLGKDQMKTTKIGSP